MKLKSTEKSTERSGRLRLAEFLPYRLSVAASVVSEGLAQAYGERFGIGVPEWRVLATLGEFKTMTAKAIGLHAHMSKVKVSRAVTALEEKGFIERTANTQDMREAFLKLTRKGQATYAAIVPLALDYEAALRDRLTEEEAALLGRVMDKLAGSPDRW